MLGMPDHHFHALIAQQRVETLRTAMAASRRPRRREDTEHEQAGLRAPRLDPRGGRTRGAALTRRTA
jgi:hypothetical protein